MLNKSLDPIGSYLVGRRVWALASQAKYCQRCSSVTIPFEIIYQFVVFSIQVKLPCTMNEFLDEDLKQRLLQRLRGLP